MTIITQKELEEFLEKKELTMEGLAFEEKFESYDGRPSYTQKEIEEKYGVIIIL